ncbi:glutamate racemase [Arsenophonus endosymbiont of Bemisia tabaci]|uniref:glutamate racemase n=1 Tax=Arsenophonus endosymbiont of Bemisia tabaci TaxID=536059 RepID=UPI0015F70AFD|nr:glutamate racemase [Arsenophonus endosymbiont of Bemisia tabaci]CAA2929311.1 Glutamate racemase [Arsenophonus endosymbiont of Bemisia tabaci Q2]
MKNEIKKVTSAQSKTARPTILIFDSGAGGLSVYREVRQLLPDLHYIYIYAFDNDAFPYGEKSAEFIIERIIRFIDQIQQKHALAIAIIACNTASTVSLPVLKAHFQFPIIGVVPAIKPATKLTRNGVIGLLATKVTVSGNYTRELIDRFAVDCKVEMIASSELVELAEKKLHGQVISKEALVRIVKPLLKIKEPPDTIVLGCTHFPLLSAELKEVLLDGTRLIDSGAAIARRAVWLINNHQNLILTKSKNIAYCTKMDVEAEKLIPVLINEGFNRLEKMFI